MSDKKPTAREMGHSGKDPFRFEDGRVVLEPWPLGCAELEAIVSHGRDMRKRGLCAQCGGAIVVEREGEVVYCPKGCFEMHGGSGLVSNQPACLLGQDGPNYA